MGIVLIAVVPILFLLFSYAGIENRAAATRATLDLQRELASDVRAMQDLITQSRATLETFGITYAIQAHRWDLAQGNARRLVAQEPEYAVLAATDASGVVRAASPQPTAAVDLSSDPLYRQALATKNLVVSGFARDPVTGKALVRVGWPVYSPLGKLVSFTYIGLEPSAFSKRMSPPSAMTAELLVDGSGVVIARTPALAGVVGRQAADTTLVTEILHLKAGSVIAPGLDGVTRQYVFSPVLSQGTGALYLATSISQSALLAPERRTFAVTLAIFAGFAILALVLAGLVGTYSIYRPALLLSQAAEKISSGDLSARAEFEDRSDEFGILKSEFNHMADTLEAQVAELESTRAKLAELNADLEERVRRRTAELEAANEELEAFSYSVSHDLRSPLRAIDGFSLALLEDYNDSLDDKGRDYLRRVRDNATRMGDLIDSLLRLSRLSRQEMKVTTVDLTGIASDIAARLAEEDPERAVEFDVQPGVTCHGDADLLRVVLENLLSNAWKFTSKHSSAKIAFGARDVGGETQYFVADDGAGFDMAYAGKLFGAFQRVHGQSEFPGIGVGLATTARIVHRHGGRVWGEGEPEKGATFYFTLR